MTARSSLYLLAPMPTCKHLRMQVGCPMRCTFCATGKGGFARNLRQHEIIDQVMTVQERMGARVSNVGEAPPSIPDRHVEAHVSSHIDPGPAFGRAGGCPYWRGHHCHRCLVVVVEELVVAEAEPWSAADPVPNIQQPRDITVCESAGLSERLDCKAGRLQCSWAWGSLC